MQSFSVGIIIRIILICCWAWIGTWALYQNMDGLFLMMIGFMALAGFNLYNHVTNLNKKLSRIFDSIQYQDFAITFKSDNKKGKSFETLNHSLNNVIKSFNHVRAEREATLHFVQAIVQQINVGILSYNTEGKIDIVNQATNKLLGIYKLTHISAIKSKHPEIYDQLIHLSSGESKLIKINNNELSINVKEIILRDRKFRLVTIHNIRPELQARELEAWQNLTKVLRHEIMNSVTPIVSLSQTMKVIIDNDLNNLSKPSQKSAADDLKIAVSTIRNRSKGIMNFVNAYREFTNIPLPDIKEVFVSELCSGVIALFESDGSSSIAFNIKNDFILVCDQDQIEQVLINTIKNAKEATIDVEFPLITVKAHIINQLKTIEIIDNGRGVNPDEINKMFVPFYTTKISGTGIGLSLSRQIMQMHNGSLEYEANEPSGSRFILVFR